MRLFGNQDGAPRKTRDAPRRTGDDFTRNRLAFWIIGASVASIAIISTVAIVAAGGERAETSRLVFSSVLPLLGTWVGTVLAFYFARENLQAATDSTLALRETATPVTSVMIHESDFNVYDLGTDQRVEDIELADVHTRMGRMAPPTRRLPIRDTAGAVLYVIHDSTLTAYAESQKQSTTDLKKTLGDLLADPTFKELVEAIGFVFEKATVADARAEMRSVKNCNDVFVTPGGKRDERAIGWLTNTLLAGIQ